MVGGGRGMVVNVKVVSELLINGLLDTEIYIANRRKKRQAICEDCISCVTYADPLNKCIVRLKLWGEVEAHIFFFFSIFEGLVAPQLTPSPRY